MSTDAPYTQTDDPEVESEIGRTIGSIIDAASSIDGVDAVLLGGSLARGEATVVRTTHGFALASDVEAYLVGGQSELRRHAARLSRELSMASGSEISVAWLSSRRLRHGWARNMSRRPARTIHGYELAAGSRLLAGERPQIAEYDPATLPLAEGILLLLNRLAEAGPAVAESTGDAGRWLDKVLLAAGDTILLAEGRYTASYRERAEALHASDPGWRLPPNWRSTVLQAYERKVQAVAGAPNSADVAEIASSVLRESVHIGLGVSAGGWHRFPWLFVPRAARDPRFLNYLPRLGPAAQYESLVVVLRVTAAGFRLSPGAVAEGVRGRPLSLWMRGAAAPLFFGILEGRPELISGAARAMQVAGIPASAVRAARAAPDKLSRLLVNYWKTSV